MANVRSTNEAVKTTAESETAAGTLSSASTTTPRTEPMKLEDAIASLNPDDDAHWTSDGRPRIEVVESLTSAQHTRADVEAAAPGFTRAKAKEAHEEPEPADGEKTEPIEVAASDVPTGDDAGEYLNRLAKQFGWPTLQDLRDSDR